MKTIVSRVIGVSLALGLWSLSSMSAMAGVINWSFNYTVGGDAASGIITTSDTPNGLFGSTAYDILSISGLRNGNAISLVTQPGTHTPGGVVSLSGNWQYNNELYAVDPFFDLFGLLYSAAGIEYNVYVQGGVYIEGYRLPGFNHVLRNIDDGSIEQVPEPGAMMLVVLGLLSVFGFGLRRRGQAL